MRFRVDLSVHFDGAFNVGSGATGGSAAQLAMVTDWRGLPTVPASSLKGRLRHTCRQFAAALDKDVCGDPVPEQMCQPGQDEGFCPVCRLFGSPWLPSPLTFTDLVLVEPAFLVRGTMPLPSSTRYGVALSRRRRVAQDKALYTTEVFTPGSTVTLRGEIRGQAEEKDLALLVAGLEHLISLGTGRTRGIGWCEVEFELYHLKDEGGEQRLAADEVRRRLLE